MNNPRTKTKDALWKELEALAKSNPTAHHAFTAIGMGMDREYVLLSLIVALCKQNNELATHMSELMAEVSPLTFNQLFNQVSESS
jgi:hypothetical protein